MKRKHHVRSTSKRSTRTVSPIGETSGPAYPRAGDAADVVERAARDLGRLLRAAARPLASATAASLLFGAMMGGCMPVVRPGEMPERTPVSEQLDAQADDSATPPAPATTDARGATPDKAD